jgi:hypothetical protein
VPHQVPHQNIEHVIVDRDRFVETRHAQLFGSAAILRTSLPRV